MRRRELMEAIFDRRRLEAAEIAINQLHRGIGGENSGCRSTGIIHLISEAKEGKLTCQDDEAGPFVNEREKGNGGSALAMSGVSVED